jgi:DNA-binding response OmpR family regulator
MSLKVLLCEDDFAIQKIVQFKLKKELSAEVEAVSDGKKALSQLDENHQYDLVITDIHMPYHSGMEIIERLRVTLKDDTKIIVLSAEGLEDTLDEAFQLGADEFITKPFSPQELITRVKKVLR